MPGGEEEELARKHAEHEDEADEDHAEEAPSSSSAAARNSAQAGAIIGRHRRGAVMLSAPPDLSSGHKRGTPILEAPSEGRLHGHRRGAVLESAPSPGRLRGHKRNELVLGGDSPIGSHRKAAPLIGGESALAKKSGVSDSAAASGMALKRAQQDARIGGGDPISGFRGDSGGVRSKPTVAPKLGKEDAENDLMRNMLHKQREGTAADLAALGPGRAPGYRGKDEATGDMRSIIEDPRFEKDHYAVDRESDHGGAAGRYAAGKKAEIMKFLGSSDKGKQAAKYAARSAIRAVPLVGSGAALGGAYKDHKRAGVDDEVAQNAENDDLTRATAMGLADAHRNNRNKEAVSGVVGVAKDITTVATGGIGALVPGIPGVNEGASHVAGSLIDRAMDKGKEKAADALTPEHLAERAAWKAGSKGGTAINKGADWLNEKQESHELRKAAVAPPGVGRPDLIQASTDRANEGALALAANDGKFGAGLLNHLNSAEPAFAKKGASVQSALTEARRVDQRDNSKAEHTLQPSKVARMVRGEQARQRQKARMGDSLGKLTQNEANRSFWEKSAGVDVAPAPKEEAHDEDETEE